MEKIKFFSRLMLTILLGIGVYSETGVWTTVWYVLMYLTVEVHAFNFKKIVKGEL